MASQHHSLSYRPEIDGLRAIAVLSVIVYHLKIPIGDESLLPGGFLGVDIFFVLSGFLITQILIREFESTGRISIADFYWRRAKRILPPLLLVMLASLPAAWMILLPSELDRFALSLLSALGFVSNFFWFFELSEYGAQSGLLQPFLHTWSLAIEEQFYLIFPPLLIILFKLGTVRTVFWAVSVGLVLSLVAAEGLTRFHPAFSFYAPSSRAWEMLAGALLAILRLKRPEALIGGALERVAPALALMVFGVSIATLHLSTIAHPGFVTLPVVIATCALLWFLTPRQPLTRLLSSKPIVEIGKLSYSLYLWHFPIFAFGRLSTVGSPTLSEMGIWVAATFGASYLGYRFIERPFRFSMPPMRFATICGAALFPIIGGAALVTSGTLQQTSKMQSLALLYGENEIDNKMLAQASWSLLDALSPDEDIGSWNALRPSQHELNDLWFSDAPTRKVLLIGDSHSKDVYNALTLNADHFPDIEVARFNIHRKSVSEGLEQLRNTPNFSKSDTIVIASRYYREYATSLERMLSTLVPTGKKIIILGPSAEFEAGGSQPLFDWFIQKSTGSSAIHTLNRIAQKYERPSSKSLEERIRLIAKNANVQFLSRRDLICPTLKECTLVTPNGLKTMYDDTHWTLQGAQLFGKRAAEAGWFSERLAIRD
jgi:peptidoglycan/LPS O-acetylase OafA/YrhL